MSLSTSTVSAQDTANKFIAHFSTLQTSHSVSSPWRDLLTDEEKSGLREEMKIYQNNFDNRKEYDQVAFLKGTSFYQITRGKHHEVWGHEKFPQLVFKRMRFAAAQQQMAAAKKAHDFVTSQPRFGVRTPVAAVIGPEGQGADQAALYVEEKLPLGMDVKAHQEFWDRIFVHYHSSACSPLFKENLFELVKQLGEFCENTGFWDVGFRNCPEISTDGTYVCATDFEKIDGSSAEGLKRLRGIFCYSPLIEHLSSKYHEWGIKADIEQEKNMEKLCGITPKSAEELKTTFDSDSESTKINYICKMRLIYGVPT